MIDKNKYLYWLSNDEDKLTEELVWRELYTRIGYIFHTIQMVEYNIAIILSIEEFEKENQIVYTDNDIYRIKENINEKYNQLSKCTFGKLKNQVEQSIYLSSLDANKLQGIVDYRNYLAHNCFKEKLLNNELNSLEKIDSFIDELNEFEDTISELNETLISIFKDKKVQPLIKRIAL